MNGIKNRLMVAGQVYLAGLEGAPVEVRRCMAIRSGDGRKLGMVAAVCLDGHSQDVVALLLGRLPVTADYRLIPIELIRCVSEDVVHLHIPAESVQELARRTAESDCQ